MGFISFTFNFYQFQTQKVSIRRNQMFLKLQGGETIFKILIRRFKITL